MKYMLHTYVCVIILCTYGGRMAAGDPAPGRSPGPPTDDAPPSLVNATPQNHRINHNDGVERRDADRKGENNVTVAYIVDKYEQILHVTDKGDDNKDTIKNLENETTALEDSSSSSSLENEQNGPNNERSNATKSQCMMSAASYIFPANQIYKVKAATMQPVRLDIMHELFDTKNGLVNTMLYIGKSFYIKFSIINIYPFLY